MSSPILDKGWMQLPRYTLDYQNGLKEFLKFAFAKSAKGGTIRCPCNECANFYWLDESTVYDHLVCNGFMVGYTRWISHGENWCAEDTSCPDLEVQNNEGDEMDNMLREGLGVFDNVTGDINCSDNSESQQATDDETYYRLAAEASEELYPGCQTISRLQFLVRLLNIKNIWGVSNVCFEEILHLLGDALPEGGKLPKSYHEAKKFVKDVGLGYTTIDACINDCILYRNQYVDADKCPVFGVSKWKSEKLGINGKRVHKVPAKVVRHFPLKRRLQRRFMSSKTASDMRWHDEGRTKDGLLRHPADSTAWRDFDFRHPQFGSESRNVRLALATDGFNPFRNCNVSHSTWPVVLIPYNVPPWICMKQSNFILSLLISGPKSPGNSIDVYFQLIVEELDLFDKGAKTFDASRNEWFTMRAAILWTISDYPGHAYVSGRRTDGRHGCSNCYSGTCSLQLKHGRKTCYMGHRRFLPPDHKFRFEASSFDGTVELREAPQQLSGYDVSKQTENLHIVHGKLEEQKRAKEQKRMDEEAKPKWKKRSCFFQLSYWETLLVRHNLDAMHIEKNVFDNIMNTLLNVNKKSKDNLNSRLDLKEMGTRSSLHPESHGNKTYIPPASFTMNTSEKKMFCEVLKNAKFPDGCASNLYNKVLVDQKKLIGLKSHDCHVIMQQLLPLAIRRVLPENVCTALIRLSNFFNKLYSKVINISDMEKLEREIAETLCLLEKIFPPSFFDVMVHLCVHLPTEARLAGPVHYRNMYPVERYLLKLKNMVRTRSHPEGSIAEGYVLDESLTFCSRYLKGCETIFNRRARNDDTNDNCNSVIFSYLRTQGRPLLGGFINELDEISWIQAHRYVLFNYEHIGPYVEKHISILSMDKSLRKREVKRIHHESFHTWLLEHVNQLVIDGHDVSEELRILANRPYKMVKNYNSYALNGYKFQTKSYSEGKSTQNYGVAVIAQTSSFSSARDQNPVVGDVTYYGVINDIIELNYSNKGSALLFKCDWVDTVRRSGIQNDKFGITLVNFNHLLNSGKNICDEPFILATQATQVYYVQDPIDSEWHAVRILYPRDVFDMQARDDLDDNDEGDIDYFNETIQPFTGNELVTDISGNEFCARTDINGVLIDESLDKSKRIKDGRKGRKRKKC